MKIFEHVSLESLNFDLLSETTESGRIYVTPEGHKYTSVTTILSELNKQAILKWRQRVGEKEANKISRISKNRGTNYHAIMVKYLCNELTEVEISRLFPETKQMFMRMRKIFDENISDICCIEQALYSDELKIAGRVDLVAKYNGILSIIDHKTSNREKKHSWIRSYFYQTALYAKMFKERTGYFPEQIVIAIVIPEKQPQICARNTMDYLPQAEDFVMNYHIEHE